MPSPLPMVTVLASTFSFRKCHNVLFASTFDSHPFHVAYLLIFMSFLPLFPACCQSLHSISDYFGTSLSDTVQSQPGKAKWETGEIDHSTEQPGLSFKNIPLVTSHYLHEILQWLPIS